MRNALQVRRLESYAPSCYRYFYKNIMQYKVKLYFKIFLTCLFLISLIVVSFFLFNKYLIVSPIKREINLTQDVNLAKFNSYIDTFIQSNIDSGYKNTIGILPDSTLYSTKIFVERMKIVTIPRNKRSLYRIRFCQRRPEESFLIFQLDKQKIFSSPFSFCSGEINGLNSAQVDEQSQTQLNNISSLLIAFNQNIAFKDNQSFQKLYSDVTKLYQ